MIFTQKHICVTISVHNPEDFIFIDKRFGDTPLDAHMVSFHVCWVNLWLWRLSVCLGKEQRKQSDVSETELKQAIRQQNYHYFHKPVQAFYKDFIHHLVYKPQNIQFTVIYNW